MAVPGDQRNDAPLPTEPASGVAGVAANDDALVPRRAPLGIGDVLKGRFVIERELGRGSGGVVFVARDRVLNRGVAIKILSRAADPVALARFAQEASAAGRLEHPNVLVVHDVGVDGGFPFIVSELLEGATLRARLQQGPVPMSEALSLARQLAHGLAAAHAQGIVHRDLKPENLFVTADGRLKILDFGVAKLLPSRPAAEADATMEVVHTATGAALGTVPYMSPEQVRGRATDTRADVFAFGAILYEMVCGRRPFSGSSDVEVGYAILTREPAALPPGIAPALDDVVSRCLAKDPANRFASAHDLAQALDALPAPTVAARKRRRGLAVWAVLAAFAAMLAARPAARLIHWLFATAPASMRLAVLPFQVRGASADGEALSAGLGEILINKLRQIDQLRPSLDVISAAELSREHVDSARDARTAFGATLALTGSMQWNPERITVTANLVDTKTQIVRAARDFEVPSDDIRAVGRLLVQKTAEMLEVDIGQAGPADAFSAPSKASSLYLQGRGYLQRYDRVENLDRALEAFDGALAADPRFALAHAGKAEAWLRRDRIIRDPSALDHARESIHRALEENPGLTQVVLTAGLVYLAGGDYARAIESFQRALQIEPANADALRELANAYDAAGQTANAESTFRRAAQLRPDSWAAVRDLGVFYNRHGRLDDALAQFQRVVVIAPDSYAAYANLGGIYLRLGRHHEAAGALQKSLALRPTSKAYMNIGTVYYFEARYREAADAYRKATQLTPADERAWGALADALRWVPGNDDEVAGAYRQAIALAEQQASINPNNADLRSRLAMYHAYAGDRDAADAELARALKLGPEDGSVLFRAALVHERLGRRERALEAVGQALRAGYSREEIGKAPALEALRHDPRYRGIALTTP